MGFLDKMREGLRAGEEVAKVEHEARQRGESLTRAQKQALYQEAQRAGRLQGLALVTTVRQTSAWVNNLPRMEIGLDVRLDGCERQEIAQKHTVRFPGLSLLWPGAVFAASADPQHPEKVEVDWERPVGRARGTLPEIDWPPADVGGA